MKAETNEFQELAVKCMKQVKNKLYFQFRSLSPAIYRMSMEYTEPGTGVFGTDSNKIYADPMAIVINYKKSPNVLMRSYLHMLFHCIYLHPFVTKPGLDIGIWNLALDICCESAVSRLDVKSIAIDGDMERKQVLDDMRLKIKMFIPELVYKELSSNVYDIASLAVLFHMDSHLWLEQSKSKSSNGQSNQNQNDSQKNSDGNSDGDANDNSDNTKKDKNDENGNDNSNSNSNSNGNENGNDNSDSNNTGNGNNNQGNNQNDSSSSSSTRNEQKKQEWSDVSRQIAADMNSFHKQGTNPGEFMQEIDYLTKDKMDYEDFLREFSIIEEKMMINQDEFDYMYYTYGLNGMKNAAGNKTEDKQVLLIEPLEYKEEKVIKDFVIAIDTSGSCSGELVKRFLNKTYSILKESESFSSRVNIHIVQCDAQIQNDTKITNLEEMEQFMKNMKLYGFGGTDFRPVFEYVDTLIKNKEFDNLCGLIYFTDGYGTYPTKPTPYKTAFAFLEDYSSRDNVPSWAMNVFWKDESPTNQ